jgi:outer membrane biosynthesis protein TonB
MAAVAAVPSLASAAAPIHLAPSSPWVVDYAANSCRLVRLFGQGSDQTKFALESEAPGALDMVLIGKPLGTIDEEVPAKFLPVSSKPMKGMVGRSTDKYLPMLLFSTVELLPVEAAAAEERKQAERKAHPGVRPPAETLAEQAANKARRQEFAANTTAIEVDARRNRPVILDTGSLGEAIKAFDQCSRDSLRDWGVDPDLEDKIVRGVWAPNPRGWFNSGDYPRDMLMRGQESVVKVRLLVDATGRPTKCTSLSHFTEAEFNKITCDKFMARAHFEPAELADGTKVPSYFVIKVNFRMAR